MFFDKKTLKLKYYFLNGVFSSRIICVEDYVLQLLYVHSATMNSARSDVRKDCDMLLHKQSNIFLHQ